MRSAAFASAELRAKTWCEGLRQAGYEASYECPVPNPCGSGFDVVVSHTPRRPGELDFFLAARKRNGFRWAVDCDHYVGASAGIGSGYHPWEPGGRMQKEAIAAADGVIFATPLLQSVMGRKAKRSAVFRMMYGGILAENAAGKRHLPGRVIIDYAHGGGTPGWSSDPIIGVLEDIVSSEPGVGLMLHGSKAEMWHGARICVLPLHVYTSFVVSMCEVQPDIGVAPQPRTLFCRTKGPTKYFDYTAFGAAGIYQDCEVYSCVEDGKNGLLASSPKDWREALRRLCRDHALRQSILDCAREDVAWRFDAKTYASEYMGFLEQVVMN